MITPGIHIESTSLLNDTYFEDCRILITEHNTKGTIGFVLNRPYGRSLKDLEEFKHIDWPLSEGGPVDQEHIFIVHSRPDLIASSQRITDTLFLGGDMKDVVIAIQKQLIKPDQLQLFIGYCGWDHGELEEEVDEGSWVLVIGD